MLKISGKIAVLKFNAKMYQTAVAKKLKEEQKRAVAAWVRAVVKSIPVYTGTARGTIAPVGRAVGEIVSPASKNSTKKFFTHRKKLYPLGFGAGADYQEHSLSTTIYSKSITYTFRFSNKLPYAVWNFLYPAPPEVQKRLKHTTPWLSLHKGAAAYENYARTEIPKNIPKHLRFVRVKIVRIA